MFPEIASRVAAISTQPVDAVLSEFARYEVRSRTRARVPAIIQQPGGTVAGKIYRNVCSEQWGMLDYFEGVKDGDYFRRTVVVALSDGETVTADTYIAGLRVREFLGKPWDPVKFAAQDLSYYCKKLLPKFLPEKP